MITSDLLRFKIDYKNNRIYPLLCPLENNTKEFEVATQIIATFDHCYKNRSNKEKLNSLIKEIEHAYKDFKLIRGLYSILERRCEFKSKFQSDEDHNDLDIHLGDKYEEKNKDFTKLIKNLSPKDIRKIIFEESMVHNIAVTDEKRDTILNTVSDKLKTTREILEKKMWSDLEENMIIYSYLSLEPIQLLFFYNISLIQTLLFSCLKIKISVYSASGTGTIWKRILREVKRLGLMYWLDKKDHEDEEENKYDKNWKNSDIECTIEGALNVIKLTERYGNAIAKLVPLIFNSERWHIQAEILRITNSGKKMIHIFEISESSYPQILDLNIIKTIYENPRIQNKNNIIKKNRSSLKNKSFYESNLKSNNLPDISNSDSILYDSNIERRFAQKFEAFETGWRIEREPEPLITVQKTAFIPDFVLTNFENKVLVEIIGFWTKEYLERKINKILQIIDNNKDDSFFMILIINFENLLSYELNEEYQTSQIKNKKNILITSYKKEDISFKEIIPFLRSIEKKYINQKFENSDNGKTFIQNIILSIKEFNRSEEKSTTLENLKDYYRTEIKNSVYGNFKLETLLKNNSELNRSFLEELYNNHLTIINEHIFKNEFIKEICNEVKNSTTLKNACDILTTKKIDGKICIDLLSHVGFKINWNGLDYSNATISFNENSL